MTFTSRISKYQRLSRLGHLEDYLEEGTVDPATLDTGLRRKLEEVQVEAGIEEVMEEFVAKEEQEGAGEEEELEEEEMSTDADE